LLDSNNLGAEDTVEPYSVNWNTATVPNGTHVLTARARDTSGNTTSASITVTVSNQAPSGLVLALGFNEGSGTTAGYAAGNGHTGVVTGATWTSSGRYGGALSFNGTNALVTVADAASLHLTSGMTLEAWVDPSVVTSAWRDVIYKGNDNYYLEGTSDQGGKPALGSTISPSPVYGSAALAAGTWTHLAATYDGSTLRLYVNGTQVASRAQTGSLPTSANPLQIGGDSLWGQYFSGV